MNRLITVALALSFIIGIPVQSVAEIQAVAAADPTASDACPARVAVETAEQWNVESGLQVSQYLQLADTMCNGFWCGYGDGRVCCHRDYRYCCHIRNSGSYYCSNDPCR
jgi:hypothetical protein